MPSATQRRFLDGLGGCDEMWEDLAFEQACSVTVFLGRNSQDFYNNLQWIAEGAGLRWAPAAPRGSKRRGGYLGATHISGGSAAGAILIGFALAQCLA